MSAPEQPQGVLLRYAGGEVYALARPVAGLVWDVSVAGSVLRCRIAASVLPEDASLRTEMDLAELAAASPIQRRIELVSATRDALIARLEREAAEHARVALEMERAPKRPARAKAKRTGKAKRRAAAKGGR